MARILLILLILTGATSAKLGEAAEKIAVIVNKNSTLQKLSNEQVKNLFLGQIRYIESGKPLVIGERDRKSQIHEEFYALAANMTPKDVSVHWAKKVFTGEAPPPPRISGDDAAAIEWVRGNPEAITYAYAKNCDAKIKIVAFLESPR